MAKSKIDAKEFMLQYGDRIGIGVAGFLALLFVVFALLGTGGGVSAEQVKDSGKKAGDAITRSEVVPDKIALKDVPEVKQLNQINELSKSLVKPIVTDQLALSTRFFEQEPLRGRFRSNPKVLQPLETTAVALVGAFRMYEVRYVNRNEEAMVLTLRADKTAPKLPAGNNNFRRGNAGQGGGPGLGGGGLGTGGGGLGLGGGSGGAGMEGSGGAPGGRGAKGGGGGGGSQPPANTKTAAKPPAGNPGGDESLYTFVWSQQVKESDILGVTIRPLRSAYIAATYPHALQTEEIAKKLQIQKHEVERLYRRIDVQRRRIYPKGSQLPDGSYAQADMVEVENPKDRSKKELKLLADADKAAASADDQTAEKDRNALAGWTDINIANVISVMQSAYSVTKSNNEGFYHEKEPIIESLVEYAGPRIAMRLPNLVRSEYPDILSKLPIFMGAVKKIKDDEKAKIPPPPRDSRLNAGGGGDEFDRLASEEPKKDEKKNEPAAEQSGQIPEYVPIRFIDVDLDANSVGGATFEYRLRVVLNNPNFKREKDVAAPEYARDEVLRGIWSPTARVSFEPDSIAFAGERDRAKGSTDDQQKEKVPVQLHKWLGKADTIDSSGNRDSVIVGDWWVEKLLIGRGEYIGRSPDLAGPAGESNLVQWVAYAYDTVAQKIGADVQKKTRTTDLYTNSILVDFQGGAFHSFRSAINNNSRKEDLPAELLILEPDGRIVSRYLSEDKNDEGRKQRFDHWKTWIEKLAKPGEKKP